MLSALRTALADGDPKALAELGPSLAQAAAVQPQLPDTPEGRRLATALVAYAAEPAGAPRQALPVASLAGTANALDDEAGSDRDVEIQPGDEEDEPEGAVFPALNLLKDAVRWSACQTLSWSGRPVHA
ncbi:hypothetical protein ACF07F_35025 [Streptomyces sp. NPDC015237]|uniref:hypothetical protein n=1 Tax=Streptomyces sp. NPDC015237 TaxID=3364949 RepID=UPI0036FC80F7